MGTTTALECGGLGRKTEKPCATHGHAVFERRNPPVWSQLSCALVATRKDSVARNRELPKPSCDSDTRLPWDPENSNFRAAHSEKTLTLEVRRQRGSLLELRQVVRTA